MRRSNGERDVGQMDGALDQVKIAMVGSCAAP
jgi:hypothetical protein